MVAALIWLLGANLMTPSEPKDSQAVWPFGLGELDGAPKRYPKSDLNATAATVQRIEGRLRPSGRPGSSIARALRSYLSAQLAKPGDTIDAPAPEIRRFLDDHAAVLDETRTLLGEGAVPHWAIDVSRPAPPIPDPEDQILLFHALGADAFDRALRGDQVTAWRDLEAGWRLAQGLWLKPDPFMMLIALSGTRTISNASSKLAAPAPAWYQELVAFNVDRAFASALQLQAWQWVNFSSRNPLAGPDDRRPPSSVAGAAGILIRPLILHRAVQRAATLRTAAIGLAASRLCSSDTAREPATFIGSIRPRLNRFRVEREAAVKLLSLKEQRRLSGAWPDSMKGIDVSVCSDGAWKYRRDADGSMTLSFLAVMEEDRSGVGLPLYFHYPR